MGPFCDEEQAESKKLAWQTDEWYKRWDNVLLLDMSSVQYSFARLGNMTLQSIQEEIKARQKNRTPRYLFRYWNEDSGGSAELNTVDEIIPRAFLKHPEKVPSFWNYDSYKFVDIARDHLETKENIKTVFSSWSHSLAFIIAWALHKRDEDYMDSAHICIMDTTKLDAMGNVVLHTHAMRQHISKDILPMRWEFLAFGPIERGQHLDAYQAVAVPDLINQGLRDFCDREGKRHYEGSQSSPSAKHAKGKLVRAAVKIAECFEPDFRMAIAVNLMSICRDYTDADFIEIAILLFQNLNCPRDWKTDPKLKADDMDLANIPEAHRAGELYRKLAIRDRNLGECLAASPETLQNLEIATASLKEMIMEEWEAHEKNRPELEEYAKVSGSTISSPISRDDTTE